MKPFCSVSGLSGERGDAESLRERRLLRHVIGDGVVDRGVVVSPVAAADDHRFLGNGRQAKPMRGEKLFLSGLTSESGSAPEYGPDWPGSTCAMAA